MGGAGLVEFQFTYAASSPKSLMAIVLQSCIAFYSLQNTFAKRDNVEHNLNCLKVCVYVCASVSTWEVNH